MDRTINRLVNKCWIVLILILFKGCYSQNNKVTIKLPGFDDSVMDVQTLMTVGSEIYLLGGRQIDEDALLSKQFSEEKATIVRYKEGTLMIDTLGDGRVVGNTSFGNSLYLYKLVSSKSAFALIDTSIVYESIDNGESWNELLKMPYYIREVVFTTDSIGYMIARDQKKDSFWVLFQTMDRGLKWQIVNDRVPINLKKAFREKEHMVLVIANEASISIESYTGDSRNRTEVPIPLGTNVADVNFFNDEMYILINRGSSSVIFKIMGRRLIEIGSYENLGYTADKFYFTSKGNICVVSSKIQGVSRKYLLYVSMDKGVNWKSKELSVPNYVNPFTFSNDTFISYAGGGIIQIVKIED